MKDYIPGYLILMGAENNDPKFLKIVEELKKIFSKNMEDSQHGVWKTPIFNQLNCECGKDRHGFASHSTWCPKHENNY